MSEVVPWRVLVFDFHLTLINQFVLSKPVDVFQNPSWIRQEFYGYADWLMDFLIRARQAGIILAVASASESRFDGLTLEQIRDVQREEIARRKALSGPGEQAVTDWRRWTLTEEEIAPRRNLAHVVGGNRLIRMYLDALFGNDTAYRQRIIPDELVITQDWEPFRGTHSKHPHMERIANAVTMPPYSLKRLNTAEEMVLFDDNEANVASVRPAYAAVRIAQTQGFSAMSWNTWLSFGAKNSKFHALSRRVYGAEVAVPELRYVYEMSPSPPRVVDTQENGMAKMDASEMLGVGSKVEVAKLDLVATYTVSGPGPSSNVDEVLHVYADEEFRAWNVTLTIDGKLQEWSPLGGGAAVISPINKRSIAKWVSRLTPFIYNVERQHSSLDFRGRGSERASDAEKQDLVSQFSDVLDETRSARVGTVPAVAAAAAADQDDFLEIQALTAGEFTTDASLGGASLGDIWAKKKMPLDLRALVVKMLVPLVQWLRVNNTEAASLQQAKMFFANVLLIYPSKKLELDALRTGFVEELENQRANKAKPLPPALSKLIATASVRISSRRSGGKKPPPLSGDKAAIKAVGDVISRYSAEENAVLGSNAATWLWILFANAKEPLLSDTLLWFMKPPKTAYSGPTAAALMEVGAPVRFATDKFTDHSGTDTVNQFLQRYAYAKYFKDRRDFMPPRDEQKWIVLLPPKPDIFDKIKNVWLDAHEIATYFILTTAAFDLASLTSDALHAFTNVLGQPLGLIMHRDMLTRSVSIHVYAKRSRASTYWTWAASVKMTADRVFRLSNGWVLELNDELDLSGAKMPLSRNKRIVTVATGVTSRTAAAADRPDSPDDVPLLQQQLSVAGNEARSILSTRADETCLHCALLGLELERALVLPSDEWFALSNDRKHSGKQLLVTLRSVESCSGDASLADGLQWLVQAMLRFPREPGRDQSSVELMTQLRHASDELHASAACLRNWLCRGEAEQREALHHRCSALLEQCCSSWAALVQLHSGLRAEPQRLFCDLPPAQNPLVMYHACRFRTAFADLGQLCDQVLHERHQHNQEQ